MKKLAALGVMLASTLYACSSEKDPAELLNTAKSQLHAGNTNTAIISLKNAIQLDPKNAEARFLLGKIYLDNHDYLNAEKEFERATSLGFSQPELALLKAKILLERGNSQGVVDYLADKSFDDNENSIKANFLLGKALLNLGETGQARSIFEQSIDIAENHPVSVLGIALLHANEGKESQALETIEELLSVNSEFGEAWLLKGTVLSKQKRFKQAAEAFEKYHELNPNNFAIRTLVADNYIKANAFELAKPHLQALVSINDNHPTVNILYSQVKYVEGDYAGAKELAEKALNVTENGLAQMIYGLSSFQLKNYEQAYYQLNAIADNLPDNHDVHKVLAVLQVKLGYLDEVAGTMGGIQNVSPDDASFFASVGIEYANKGDKESAIAMFNKANNLAPTDPAILTQLGAIKLFNKDVAGGQEELAKAIDLVPDFEAANIALAKLHLKNNDIEKAVAVAEEWLAKSPADITAMLLRGHIAMKANEPNKAKEYFIKVNQLEPDNVTSLFNLAVVSTEEGDYKQSNQYLDKLFAINLEYPLAYRLAISNAMKLNDSKSLEAKLERFVQNSPDAFWPRIIIARRYNVHKNVEAALKTLDGASNLASAPHEYFLTYVNVLKRNGRDSEIKALYKKWQLAQPDSPRAYLTYVSILESEKAYDQALNVVTTALSKDALKTNFQLQAYEAYYLVMTNQLEMATQKVNRLKAIKPNHPYLLRVQGQLALALDKFDDAATYFAQSYAGNQKVSTALMLVTAYQEGNKTNKAIAFLENELTKNPMRDVYRRLLAGLYIKSDPELAIKHYVMLIEKNPDDVISMNNLAWVYLDSNQVDLAHQYIAKATQYAPNHPHILDTYGVVLTKQNKLVQAIESLEKANKILPNNADIQQHLAEAYSKNGQKDLALELTKNL
ncbi:XrtA/PEP-CTERM system TPR-repeat protein PrsT [Thalassotalea sediminis]|uniref:XrtA/PEP-CTERM system TPR-repeat protein PrsT n=1 Tax=Thalassotalea sediminis TaxID=1759089 RepID=UPI002574273B|nr:XrtA/PEP-CTERM system TPR-repeat protein PrsT [Thalassotalea sediminis]